MASPSLIDVPVIDVGGGEELALATFAAERARLDGLLASAARAYTRPGLILADRRTKSWARKLHSPYAEAVRDLDLRMGQPGAHLLNYSYEWGCTTGGSDDAVLGGTTMLRTLDWPFDGLGRALIVARQQSAAGSYLVVTWPGFVGVLTAMAPGRFAAAINQPPLPSRTSARPLVGLPIACGPAARAPSRPTTSCGWRSTHAEVSTRPWRLSATRRSACRPS